METREFFLEEDGNQIHCKLDYPPAFQGDTRCPLLILEHGLTGHMEERHIVAIAQCAQATGFAVLRVELYGHGRSSGAFRDHTVLKWVSQMVAVFDYAVTLPFVTALYLAGHSQGGLTTMLVGALEQDRLKAILPLAPATVIRDMARAADPIPPEFPMGGGKVLGNAYLRTARMLPVEESIRCFHKPVLLVHGDADEAVPVRYAYEAAALYPNCTLKIIPGDTHCYDHHLDQVCQAVEAFLREMEQE